MQHAKWFFRIKLDLLMSVDKILGSHSIVFQDMEQKMKMLENLQDDFDFNYKTLKSAGGKSHSRFYVCSVNRTL